MSNQWGWSTWK